MTVVLFLFIAEAINGRMLTSPEVMSRRGMTWTKGAVPPRFGYFVEGQSNAVGRPVGDEARHGQAFEGLYKRFFANK